MAEPSPFDPERLITTLARHGVEYVLVGALAARLHGFPRLTADADIMPSRQPENLSRLADALQELNARVYTDNVPEGLPFEWDRSALTRGEIWNLVTAAGRLDVIFAPGDFRFDDLVDGAVEFEVFGSKLLAADLPDIILLKEAADRPQDRQDIIILREMLRRREESRGG